MYLNRYKTILSERCDPQKEYANPLIRFVMKKYYKNANGFIFQTEKAKRYYNDIISCYSEVIPNPLNNKFIGKEYQGDNSKTIVNVGRLSKQKNQAMLINAFSNFLKDNPEYILKIYGEGSLKRKLIKLANEKKAINNVKFMGIVDNLYDTLIYDKIFVLSSNYEGMPNALMEAMALGMPCIATDCPVGGPETLIKNNENGILIPVNDSNSLTKALNELIKNNELCKKISGNAKSIQKELNEEIIMKRWEKFFLKVIENY